MLTRQTIVDNARAFLGTKFLHQGRTDQGCDCAGLVYLVGKVSGFPVSEETVYSLPPPRGFAERIMNQWGNPLVGDPGPIGSVGLFWITKPGVGIHMAIYTGKNLVHSVWGRGVVENGYADFWKKRLIRWYDFKGVEQWQP